VLSVGQYYLERHFGRGFGLKEAEQAEKRTERRAARVLDQGKDASHDRGVP